MTCPPPPTQRNQHNATTMVGALLPMPSCLGIGGTPVGPGKDTHGAQGQSQLFHNHFVDDVFAHSLDLSLGRCLPRFLEDLWVFHLHCVDDSLDLCVQKLFNDSLGPDMKPSSLGTVCSQLAA